MKLRIELKLTHLSHACNLTLISVSSCCFEDDTLGNENGPEVMSGFVDNKNDH